MIDILFPVDSGLKVLEHLHQKILILLYFTISKSHFIIISKKKKTKKSLYHYTISFYNTSSIPKLYFY